jgi:hypothetical protein
MEILETAKKGNLMNIKEDFQIHYHNKHKKINRKKMNGGSDRCKN